MNNSPADIFVDFIQGKDPKDPERVKALRTIFDLFDVSNDIMCCRECGKLGIAPINRLNFICDKCRVKI